MEDLRAPRFELFLFTRDVARAASAAAAGIDGIVIDLERDGKRVRQLGADTEVNEDTIDDLRTLRAATAARILCRVNAVGGGTADEVAAVIEAGADELLVPMVRDFDDVDHVLDIVDGRIDVGIMVETGDAVANAVRLGRLPLSRVFVGLNDLAIERGSPSIFSALVDGTVDRVREAIDAPFGVAGLTVPEAGDPVPSTLLIGELARLRCDFSVLRRSFRRDTEGRDLDVEVARLRRAVTSAFERSDDQLRSDRDEFVRTVDEIVYGTSLALHG